MYRLFSFFVVLFGKHFNSNSMEKFKDFLSERRAQWPVVLSALSIMMAFLAHHTAHAWRGEEHPYMSTLMWMLLVSALTWITIFMSFVYLTHEEDQETESSHWWTPTTATIVNQSFMFGFWMFPGRIFGDWLIGLNVVDPLWGELLQMTAELLSIYLVGMGLLPLIKIRRSSLPDFLANTFPGPDSVGQTNNKFVHLFVHPIKINKRQVALVRIFGRIQNLLVEHGTWYLFHFGPLAAAGIFSVTDDQEIIYLDENLAYQDASVTEYLEGVDRVTSESPAELSETELKEAQKKMKGIPVTIYGSFPKKILIASLGIGDGSEPEYRQVLRTVLWNLITEYTGSTSIIDETALHFQVRPGTIDGFTLHPTVVTSALIRSLCESSDWEVRDGRLVFKKLNYSLSLTQGIKVGRQGGVSARAARIWQSRSLATVAEMRDEKLRKDQALDLTKAMEGMGLYQQSLMGNSTLNNGEPHFQPPANALAAETFARELSSFLRYFAPFLWAMMGKQMPEGYQEPPKEKVTGGEQEKLPPPQD